ncbi:MAG: CsbD family protein [Chloroflexi bacterium]|nr:MAG: CsbD family protein [Chloroflexota bacterium]
MTGDADRLAGKTKELGGKVTGDRELETEGKTQHAEGKAENAIDDAAAKVKGSVNAVKDKLSRDDTTR